MIKRLLKINGKMPRYVNAKDKVAASAFRKDVKFANRVNHLIAQIGYTALNWASSQGH